MSDSSQHDEAFLRLARYLELIDENQADACLQICHSSGKPAEQVATETQFLQAMDIQKVQAHMSAMLTINTPSPDGPTIGNPSTPQKVQRSAPLRDEDSTATRAANSLAGSRATTNPRASAPSSDPDARPVSLGRYQLGSLLGRGGMGSVYQAHDDALDRSVAVKMITPGGASPEMLTRFQREARAVASMGQHPNIVGVHDFGQQDDTHYIVMDLVRGGDLEAWLAQPSLSQRKIVQAITQAARGVGHAHTRNIIHRDLKPANVLMTEDGIPKVSDFGLARNLKDSVSLTTTGQVMGTPAYMAPEQVGAHAGELTPATDVFALGVLLYETLTSTHPFLHETVQPTMMAVLHHLPPAPRELNPRIPPDLNTIIVHCIRKNPIKRYPDANALAADLGRFLAGEAITARPLTRRERAGRWYRRNQRMALPGLIVTALAIALGGGGLSSAHLTRKAEHAAALKEAKEDFQEARSRFLKAHAADPDHCFEPGVGFLWEAEKVLALDPSDPGLRQATYEAANFMTKAACQTEQWDLARIALGWAERTGVNPNATEQSLKDLKAQREAATRRHSDTVKEILKRSRSGELAKTSQGEQEALFELIRHGTPETVDLMVKELKVVTKKLVAASSQALLGVNELTSAEQAIGLKPIAHLEDALEVMSRLDPDISLTEAQDKALEDAGRRLEKRSSPRGFGTSHSSALPFRRVLARAQVFALEKHEAATARLCVNALSRIDLPEQVTPALGEFLLAQWDQQAATEASLALCRAHGPSATTAIRQTLKRFGWEGLFGERVCPFLYRSLGPLSDEASKDDLLFRARLSVAVGLTEDGKILAKQALVLDEKDPDGLTLLATALNALNHPELASTLLAQVLDQTLTRKQEAAALRQSALARLTTLQQTLLQNRTAADPHSETAVQELAKTGLKELDRAGELDPWTGKIPLTQALIHSAMGNHLKAIAASIRATSVEPDLAEAWFFLGQGQQRLDQHEGALVALSHATSLAPDKWHYWLKRAQSNMRLGFYMKAIADATRSLALEPNHQVARIIQAEAYLNLNDPAMAQSLLEPALPPSGAPRTTWDQNNAIAMGLQGRVHLMTGNFKAAISYLEKAIAAGATGRLTAKSYLASFRIKLGEALLKSGNPARAVHAFNEALNLNPNLMPAWNRRAMAHFSLQNYEAALRDSRHAITLSPQTADLHLQLANMLRQTGNSAQALKAYDTAISLRQDLPMAWGGKGMIYLRQGDLKTARNCLEMARDIAPQRMLFWLELAKLELQSHKPQLALSNVNEALKRLPSYLEAYFVRAQALAALGDKAGARRDLRQVLQRGDKRSGLVAKAQKMLSALEGR